MGFETRIATPLSVVSTPGYIGGRPRIDGTRIPAEMILLYLREKATRQEIFEDFPSLPVGGIEAVLDWALQQGLDVQIPD